MILPCEIRQLDIRDVGRNHILSFFLVSVRKIISVQEFYSGRLFHLSQFILDKESECFTDRIQIPYRFFRF